MCFLMGESPWIKTPVSFNQMGSPDVGNTFEAFEGGVGAIWRFILARNAYVFFGGKPMVIFSHQHSNSSLKPIPPECRSCLEDSDEVHGFQAKSPLVFTSEKCCAFAAGKLIVEMDVDSKKQRLPNREDRRFAGRLLGRWNREDRCESRKFWVFGIFCWISI